VVEAEFLAKAARLGFRVSKPWGDSDRYDFVVESQSGLWRVQVKHTTYRRGMKYFVSLDGHGKKYTAEEIDFLVVYVEPENLWYVLPIERVASLTRLVLYPWSRKSKFDRYRDAWCLLTCSRKTRGWNDIPIFCRGQKLGIRCAACPHGQGHDTDDKSK
jgi:PD-(D/E)XK endonuclease